ncbi:MAG TPA: hypothetical protein VFQ61_31055 [Polyangiaceae bacterium]|nr:hypothetical protein [Polyangiaceae bacterium]
MSDPERTQNTPSSDVDAAERVERDGAAISDPEPVIASQLNPISRAELQSPVSGPVSEPGARSGARRSREERSSASPFSPLQPFEPGLMECGAELMHEKTSISHRRSSIKPAPADWRPQSSRRPAAPMVVVRSGDAQPLSPGAATDSSAADPLDWRAAGFREPFPLARDLQVRGAHAAQPQASPALRREEMASRHGDHTAQHWDDRAQPDSAVASSGRLGKRGDSEQASERARAAFRDAASQSSGRMAARAAERTQAGPPDRAAINPAEGVHLASTDGDGAVTESGPRERVLPAANSASIESKPRRGRQIVLAAGLALASSVIAFTLVRLAWPPRELPRHPKTQAATPAADARSRGNSDAQGLALGMDRASLVGSAVVEAATAALPPTAADSAIATSTETTASGSDSSADATDSPAAASASAESNGDTANPNTDANPNTESNPGAPEATSAATLKEAGAAKRRVRLDVVPFDAKVSLHGLTQKGPPYFFDVPNGKHVAVEVVRRGYVTRRVEIDGARPTLVIGLLKKPGR